MGLILLFRVALLSTFLLVGWKWGDWKHWRKYYPTLLFVMTVNLTASFLAYHHSLWIYQPDLLVKSSTIVELLNSYVMLPISTLLFLSNYPSAGAWRQCCYVLLWIGIYAILEWIDSALGGITYAHGWSLTHSHLFDCIMFPIWRFHHLRPLWGWAAALLVGIAIILSFDFLTGEIK